MNKDIQEKDSSVFSMINFLICFTVTIIFYNYMYNVTQDGRSVFLNALAETNVEIYVAGLIVFSVSYIILEFIIGNSKTVKQLNVIINSSTIKLNRICGWVISLILCAAGVGLYVHWNYITQWDEAGVANGTFYDFPVLFRALLILIGGGIIINIVRLEKDISKVTLYSIYGFSVLITIMQIYINPFACIYGSNDFTMSIYDNTSITETIYNVYDMVPFDYNTSSLYGHYGLFFLLPLRILGRATPEKVVGLLACAGGIAQLATVYIINHFSPKRWIAGLLCLAAVIRMSYGYLAISPIRTMWPLIIGAYVVYMVKHEFRLRYEFMGIVLCSLAVVWNTETGIACSFGFAVYTFFMNYRKIDCDAKLSKKYFFFMQNILMLLVKMIFSLLIAVLIVNVYNVICGAGYLMFRGFFYPYQDSNFIYELLRCNPPSGNHAWVYIMALLLAMIAWGVKEEWFCSKTERNEKKDDAICAMSLACIGLVAFVYYMNEAHWGCMEIVHQICFGLIAIILGRIYKYIHNAEGKLSDLILRGIALLSLMIALFLAVNVYNDPVRFAARNYAGAYSFETFHQDTTQLQNEIPENTFGVGQGVSIIYHSIGWNNNLKFRDTTALTIDHTGTVFDAAINEILKNDTFLITDFFYDQEVLNAVLQRDPSYKKVKTVTVNGWDFCLYSR